MSDERLEELLLQWQESVEAGRGANADELCADCPELLAELSRRIAALRSMAWVDALAGGHISRFTPFAPGAEPVPGYRLVQPIGRGGFGEVWNATDPNGNAVALKFVPVDGNAAAAEARAVDALKQLRHPHLLETFGAWQTGDFLVIAMQLAERTMLDSWREARRQGLPGIPRDELLDYVGAAANALDYLNANGISHRDVKPANLLLVRGTLKVGDFGLARLLQHSVTGHTGALTLAYACPEFFDGKTSKQSDQYSLAATYCQLRGGRLPFEGTPAQMVAGHLHRQPDLTSLPENERPVIARALSKRPAERWEDCSAFVRAIADAKPRAATRRRLTRRAMIAATALAVPAATAVAWWSRSKPQPEEPAVRAFDALDRYGLIRRVAVAPVGAPYHRPLALSNGSTCPALWDLESGKVIRRFAAEGGAGAAIAPNELGIGATAHDDATIILWDLVTGEEIRRLRGHTNAVNSVAFSADGGRILSGACDGTVRLWETRTGRLLRSMEGHTGFVMSVAFDTTGRFGLSGSWDSSVRQWDLETGKQLKNLEGHTSQVVSVAYSLDGRYALSGSLDNTARLWDLSRGQEVRRFEGHTEQVNSVCFWRSRYVLSGGDYTVRLWSLDGRELVRSPSLPGLLHTAIPVEQNGRDEVVIGTANRGLFQWAMPNFAR